MKTSTKITPKHLVNLLLKIEKEGGLKGTIVSYKSDTEPKMNKKSRVSGLPCPFLVVRKVTISGARFGVSYKKAVENKAEKITGESVTFEPEKQNGISFVEGSKIVQVSDRDETKNYLRLTFDANRKPKTVFLADGKEIAKSELTDFLPVTQSNFIEVRSIGIDNIKSLSMNGKKYEIVKG